MFLVAICLCMKLTLLSFSFNKKSRLIPVNSYMEAEIWQMSYKRIGSKI